jgi:eukaryotic-like serine/threonine-protein kinase
MRVRLERYEKANSSVQTRSLLAFVFGGIGVIFFGFIAFLGILMLFMPTGPGGGLWEQRSGIFLGLFMGLIPAGISGLVIAWGARQRGRFRRLGELAAIARQTPSLTTAQIAHALRLSIADADRLIIEAGSLGLVEDGPPANGQASFPPGHRSSPPGHAPPQDGSTPPPAFGPFASAGGLGLAPTLGAHAHAHAPHTPAHDGPPVVAPARATTASGRPSGEVAFGAVLGDVYRIEEPLGRGGMGAVHAARHLRTGRRYAVKTMLAGASASEDTLRRFEREATAASALGHPGIVQVHDFNLTPDGLFYLVMDLLEGETLERRLTRASPLAWLDAQRIAVELCAALGAAHEHGLLHRDIKPSNVFLAKPTRASGTAERTVLVDFGLVKPMMESGSQLTSTGAVVGTPMYMSPEQARGEPLDVRSDLYSLAAVVFESITGAPPFADRTMASVYARLLNDPPPRASQVSRRPVPRALDDVLVRALAKDRAARYPTARALGQALASIDDDALGAPIPATDRMTS